MHEHTYAASPTIKVADVAQLRNAALGSLARRIVGRATGTTLPTGIRLGDEPKQRLWLGMLSSEPEILQQAADRQAFRNKVTPPAQGFMFRVAELPKYLDVALSFAVYVNLHPTRQDQKADAERAHDVTAAAMSTAIAAQGSTKGHPLAPVWQKVVVGPVSMPIELVEGARRPRKFEQAVADAAREAVSAIPRHQLYRPRRTSQSVGLNPRDHDFADDAAWASYCANNLLGADAVKPPEHRAGIHVEVTATSEGYEILLLAVNTTPPDDHQIVGEDQSFEAGHLETRIYEVELTAECSVPAVPYDLEQVAQSYRYRRDVTALGHACPVTVKTAPDGTTILRTQFAAEEPTDRVHTREMSADLDGVERPIDTSFDSMISDPVGTTRRLADLLEIWVEREWNSAALTRMADDRGWEAEARKEADAEAEAARQEVAWIRAGLRVLEQDPAVRDAFVAMNRAMKRAAHGKFDAWRAFQIAWIVGCLPGVSDPAAHKDVNIVSFSTGGGKSEAYLGLMLVTLFHSRYTGVTGGCEVWARFPLRLLALQQAERFARAILYAEIIRKEDTRISSGAPFGLGYFVGGSNTPNKLFRPEPGNRYHQGAPNPDDPKVQAMCQIVDACPVCGHGITMRFDDRSSTMQHLCENRGCEVAGVLPIWSVDDAIYRFAPSVIVGTVDKLALLGLNPAFQIILGRAHSRCPDHGYTATPQFCAVFGCKEARLPAGAGLGHLRLEIADELHLLDESLGALDGMYETLLHAINHRFKNPPFQIVGATATIEGYQNQVDHLYKRTAHRFPANGPRPGETFWAAPKLGDPLRRYVGVRPRAGTMITATREIAVTHDEWVKTMLSNPESVAAESGLDPTDGDVLREIRRLGEDLYEVLLAYCLRIEDLTSFTRDDRVVGILPRRESLVVINSDAGPAEIQHAVRRLAKPPADPADRVKIVAATKAIGHGFDVARLGVMAVMGTPNQAAEIIQASARVGRVHPGLVINVINPTRDRDASVYRYYAEWIRYLDRLVHKVPVNRESLPVLKRVLPGGFMAWVLQGYDRQWVTGAKNRKSLAKSTEFRRAVKAGVIDRIRLMHDLADGFGIDRKSQFHKMHRDVIEAWVDDHLRAIELRGDAESRLSDLLHPSVPKSLRDIEEPITIYGQI